MEFNELYNLIRKDSSLFEELTLDGKNFVKNNELENFNDLKKSNNKIVYKGINYSRPELIIKPNLICPNHCNYCPNVQTGEIIDFKKLYSFLPKTSNLTLTGGGDPLLTPENDLENFLLEFKKSAKEDDLLMFMTSGIIRSAPFELKNRYYSNLESLYLLGKELNAMICFSYSEDSKSDEKLKDFSDFFNYLTNTYLGFGFIYMSFRLLFDDEKNLPNLFEKFCEINNVYYDCDLEKVQILNKKNSENEVILNNNCYFYLGNSLNVDSFGDVHACCSLIPSFKSLPKFASINESFEDINKKRWVYYGLLSSFQESYKNFQKRKGDDNLIHDNCTVCVNLFPKYLENMFKKIKNNTVMLKNE